MNYNKTLLYVKEEFEELSNSGLDEKVSTLLVLANNVVSSIMLLLYSDYYRIRELMYRYLFLLDKEVCIINNE